MPISRIPFWLQYNLLCSCSLIYMAGGHGGIVYEQGRCNQTAGTRAWNRRVGRDEGVVDMSG